MHKENCFLVYYTKYSDSDAVLHCFSEEKGFQSYFLKGIFTSKNKKKGYLQPLNELALKTKKKSISAMPEIVDFDAVKVHNFNNTKINTILFFTSDFLNIVLRDESESKEIYCEIKKFMLEVGKLNYNAHLIFTIKLLKIIGLSPLVSHKKFLDIVIGMFSNTQTNTLFSEEISEIWKNILISDKPYSVDLNRNLRSEILDSILLYYTHHHSGFKIPKSLEIIRQLW